MDRYHLTVDEFRTLLGLVQGIEWKESNGGLSTAIDPQTGKVKDNTTYRNKHLNSVYNVLRHKVNDIRGRNTSQGLGSVKVKDLEDLPVYNKNTDYELGNYSENTPQFGGLSTFASLAQRFNYIKEQAKQNPSLLYNEDGSINTTTLALIATEHNQGMKNIGKNIRNTIKTGRDEISQYQNFEYPSAVLQIIKGHNVSHSKPQQLDEVIVTSNK